MTLLDSSINYGLVHFRLYSYIITHDTGFSPNPFRGYCTLANCKPAIRRTAQVGDWIVGLSPKARGNRVVYAMRVEEVMEFAEYFRDPRFAAKKPDYTTGRAVDRRGDNIYEPLRNGGFRQLHSRHSNGDQEDPKNKVRDLGGINVLVSETFHYFGADGPELPPDLSELKVGRAHRNRFPQETITRFLEFIGAYPQGVAGRPTMWPEDDESWRPQP